MQKRRIVRQLRHGQITIPKEFREALGLEPEDLLSVSMHDGRLELSPVRMKPNSGGSEWLRDLYAEFAPAREALKPVPEAQIDAAIDKAVREVRRRKK